MSRLIPEEAAMARIFPAVCPVTKGGAPVAAAERQLFDRLARDLDAGWQIIHDCEVLAGSELISIAFVLLHRDYGIALLGIAEPGDVDDPDIAIAAMRATLEEIGFTRRYRGHIALVARTILPAAVSDLPALLSAWFAAAPPSAIGDPTWLDWLLPRLVASDVATPGERPMGAATAELGLRAPTQDESWRISAGDQPSARAAQRDDEPGTAMPRVRVAPERIPVSRVAQIRSPLWAGMALAVLVVSVVLVGMAVLSHGNGPPGGRSGPSASLSPVPTAPSPSGAVPAPSSPAVPPSTQPTAASPPSNPPATTQ
jgi:hypothetical protein